MKSFYIQWLGGTPEISIGNKSKEDVGSLEFTSRCESRCGENREIEYGIYNLLAGDERGKIASDRLP